MKLVDFLNVIDEHFELSDGCVAFKRIMPGTQRMLPLGEYAEIEDSDTLYKWIEKHEDFLSGNVLRVDFDVDGRIMQIIM